MWSAPGNETHLNQHVPLLAMPPEEQVLSTWALPHLSAKIRLSIIVFWF